MVKQLNKRYTDLIVPTALLLLALTIWLAVMYQFRLDDSFITYRYARNLMRGWGLVYNQGDAVLSTTAPLYAVLLGVLNIIIPDFHVLGGFIGMVCIGLGGGLITVILPRHWPLGLRAWAGILYVMSSPLWLALGMETALWLMLVLAAVWLTTLERWPLAGLFIGLAILTRPDAALPGFLIGLTALMATIDRMNSRRRVWLPVVGCGLMAALPVVIFGVLAWATYGSPFPATLGAKSVQALLGITGLGAFVTPWDGLRLILRSLMAQSPLYIAFALLAVFGLAGRLTKPIWLVVAWGALHLIAYMVMKIAPYRWYYAPLVPGLVLLASCGLYFIDQRLKLKNIRIRPLVVVAIAAFPLIAEFNSFEHINERIQIGGPADVMLPIVDWKAYRDVGEWLNTQTAKDATVGVAEVGQVGFYADRWMTDYLGLLQPEVTAMLRRNDLYSWLAGYAPDYLVFQRFRGAPLVLYNYLIGDNAWFKASYQQAVEFDDPRYSSGPVTIFKRITPSKAVHSQQAQFDFAGLRLIGLATDGYDLDAQGGTVRVRLDWQVVGTIPAELHIAVKGINMPDNPSYDGDYLTGRWNGSFSTWHGFVVPSGVKPGGYPLLVAVGPKGGPYNAQKVGQLDVSFPKILSSKGLMLEYNGVPQLQLVHAQSTLENSELRIDWTWRAEHNLTADYTFFVHIVPEGGEKPAAQVDGQPLEGSYPTHLWQQDEAVPMTIRLAGIPTLPGKYNVFAGWYLPSSGQRLKTRDGSDQLLLAQIVVSSMGSDIIPQVSD